MPANTVYSTGPHKVTARIYTWSGTPISPFLFVESTLEGEDPTYDTLEMQAQGGDLWTVEIPNKHFGSQVAYTLELSDALGNSIELSGGFSIVRLTPGTSSGNLIVGTGTVTSYNYPVNLWYGYTWSRQIYLASELSAYVGLGGGTISRLAWYYDNTTTASKANQKCYFKAVDATVCTSGYVDPVVDGATLVWSGSFTVSASRGWKEIILTTPFVLPIGKNLMVYWIDEAGAYNGCMATYHNANKYDNLCLPRRHFSVCVCGNAYNGTTQCPL
jgi:hypothetical protein